MRSFKNLLTAAAFAATFLAGIQANAQSFDEGTNAINLGLGFGGYRFGYSSGYAYTQSPTFTLAFDRGVKQIGPGVLGIGGVVAFNTSRSQWTSYGWNTTYNYEIRRTNVMLGARGTYHWNEWHGNDKLDLYAGVLAGFSIGAKVDKSTKTVNGVTSSHEAGAVYSDRLSLPFASAFAGVRYLFTSSFGVYAEAGYGISLLNGGLTFKF